VEVEEREDWPEILRYHFVPVGNPDSVNVTSHVSSVKVTDSETALPFTVKLPDDGLGLYILFTVATV